MWAVSWEDDLIMTNVRSFDVKAYDNAFAGYADLGWGDDLRLWLPYQNEQSFISPSGRLAAPPYLAVAHLTGLPVWPTDLARRSPTGSATTRSSQTLAHEGRMPPIIERSSV